MRGETPPSLPLAPEPGGRTNYTPEPGELNKAGFYLF